MKAKAVSCDVITSNNELILSLFGAAPLPLSPSNILLQNEK